MRLSLLAVLPILSACGPGALALPDDPIDRAATCGVVATIAARAAVTEIKAPLPFEAQERVLHYPLLAGAEGGSHSADRANAVLKRMPALQEEIAEGKWQDLVPACREAFPATVKSDVKLPGDRFAAQLQCDELGDYVTNALGSQDANYAGRLNQYGDLARALDARLGPGLRARAGGDLGAQQEARRKALAAAAQLGPPSAVMTQCLERFGPKEG